MPDHTHTDPSGGLLLGSLGGVDGFAKVLGHILLATAAVSVLVRGRSAALATNVAALPDMDRRRSQREGEGEG